MTNKEIDALWDEVMRRPVANFKYDFARLVAAAEREACAKVCKNEEEELLYREGQTLPRGEPMLLKMASVAGVCAAAIRARSEALDNQ